MPRKTRKAKRGAGANRATTSLYAQGGHAQARPSLLNSRTLGGVPDTSIVTLRYVQKLTMTSSSLIAVNVFRGNGPFDPDQTGTGAQPVWYDDYSLFYNRQRTLSSRCSVSSWQQLNSGLGTIVGVTPQHITGTTTWPGYVAQPNCAYMGCNANTPGRTVSMEIATKDFLGYKAGTLGSDDLESLYSTTPAHQWYWHVWMESGDGTSIANTLMVIIDYTIMWFDRVDGALDYQARLKRLSKLSSRSIVERATEAGDSKALDGPGRDSKAGGEHELPLTASSRVMAPVNMPRPASKPLSRTVWADCDDDAEPDYVQFQAWRAATRSAVEAPGTKPGEQRAASAANPAITKAGTGT